MGGHVDGYSMQASVIAGSPKPFTKEAADPEKIRAAFERSLRGHTFAVGGVTYRVRTAGVHWIMPSFAAIERALAGGGATPRAGGKRGSRARSRR